MKKSEQALQASGWLALAWLMGTDFNGLLKCFQGLHNSVINCKRQLGLADSQELDLGIQAI